MSTAPTLLEDLHEAAKRIGESGDRDLSHRLFDHARRLAEEFERADKAINSGDNETANAGARRMNLLTRLNGGPLVTP